MPSNSVLITTLAVLVLSFLGLYAMLGSAAGAACVAAGAAVLTALAGQALSDRARRGALSRELSAATLRVAARAGRVADPETRAALLRACDIIPSLVERTERADPGQLPALAAGLRGGLASVESVLDRYLEMQEHPARFRDTDRLLARSREILRGFEHFAAHTAEQIGDPDLESFFTDLARLELSYPPVLPPSEDR
ncbi:hypothetical protein [Nocardia sp. NPDC057668]|uniref:hypothetical protein n=1 Tax=Nocardia sp. NPDC057668 TaxID=3346202 RepID=UPI003672AFAB